MGPYSLVRLLGLKLNQLGRMWLLFQSGSVYFTSETKSVGFGPGRARLSSSKTLTFSLLVLTHSELGNGNGYDLLVLFWWHTNRQTKFFNLFSFWRSVLRVSDVIQCDAEIFESLNAFCIVKRRTISSLFAFWMQENLADNFQPFKETPVIQGETKKASNFCSKPSSD